MTREEKAVRFSEPELWSTRSNNQMLQENVDAVLGAAVNLPLRFWKPQMFFTGVGDKVLRQITEDRFPKKALPGKTHPVFSLKALPGCVGFSVCPCTSKKPRDSQRYRYINKGCSLKPTKYIMDRNSFLVETIRFNIPSSVAFTLRFRGEVPARCITSKNMS